jgi:mannose-6-phosphate isomerase-like protein (cupin superfamily)
VQIVDGAAMLHVVIVDGSPSFGLKAGMVAIVPQGAWHHFKAPTGQLDDGDP